MAVRQLTDANGAAMQLWFDDQAQAYYDHDPTPAAPANPYEDKFTFGPDPKTTIALLDKAARDNGIDPATIDWTKYANPVAIAMLRASGGAQSFTVGTPAAYVANLILREASSGVTGGVTDPRFAAKVNVFTPDPTGANGYYDNQGQVYKATEAQAQVRDQADHDRHKSDGVWTGFSETVGDSAKALGEAAREIPKSPQFQGFALMAGGAAALGGGAAAGAAGAAEGAGAAGAAGAAEGAGALSSLGGAALDSATLLANGGDAAFAGLGNAGLGSAAAAGAEAGGGGTFLPDMTGFNTPLPPMDFGPVALDTSGFSTGSSLTAPALETTGTMSSLGSLGLPPGSMVNLADSAYFMPIAGAEVGSATGLANIPTPSITPSASSQQTPIGGAGPDSATVLANGGVTGGATAAGGTEGADLLGIGNSASSGYESLPGTTPYGGVTTTAAAGGAGTALSRILSGVGTVDDFASVLGKAAPGLIGAFGASQQAKSLDDLTKRLEGYGAPSRARYEASFAPGFDLAAADPAYKGALDQTSESLLRKLSASGGNPFGNPGGLIEANKAIVNGTALPALNTYRNQNANTGGLGALASAYPSSATSTIGANSNILNALGGAASDVLNPKPQSQPTSLADLYKLINSGLSLA